MDDVIEEILIKLPVKHVLRCKLLSKSCYDLIQTPSFIKKHHLRRQKSDRSKIIVGTRNTLEDKGFSWVAYTLRSCGGESQLYIPSSNLCTILVGSCNGLLVFSSSARWDNLVVCNPATRKYMTVPKPPMEHMLKYYTNALGFAYDDKTGDYKLIKIGKYYVDETYSCLIQVWSMNTNSWKQINPAPMPLLISDRPAYNFCYGLWVNGILYWFVHGEHSRGRDPTILSFDPTNDMFGDVALPKEATSHYKYDTNVIDFMDSLALSSYRSHSRDFHCFDIWVMGSSSEWTKKFSIGPLPIGVMMTRLCINGNFVLYGITRRSEAVDDCTIISYDPHRNERVREAKIKGLRRCSRVAWSLTESLVSLPKPSTCSNDDDDDEEEEVVVNKLLRRMPLLGILLGCVGLVLHLLLRTCC